MKIFSLTCNELFKQFKKTSIKVIIPLILIAAIILPIVLSKIENTSTERSYEQSNKYQLEQAESRIDELKADKTPGAAVAKDLAEAEREGFQLSVDYKIGGYEDWRSVEAAQYRSVLLELEAIEQIIRGAKSEVLLENLFGVDLNRVAAYYEMTMAKQKEVQANLIAKRDEIKNIIVNNDYMKSISNQIKIKEGLIEEYKKTIVEYEKLVAKNQQDEDGKAALEEAKKLMEEDNWRIPQLEQDIAILKFRYDNKIDYNKNNWKNKSIITIEEILGEYRTTMMTEKEFNSNAPRYGISMSYDEYVANYKAINEGRVERIKELWYGLEKDIPDLNAVKDARSVVDSTYEVFVILAVLIIIIIAGGIVSTEFSNGTIRLLLIRPVARWKVLLSKLLAVLLIGMGVVVVSIALLVISSGAVFGFETLGTPIIQTVAGTITEVSYIRYMIPQLSISIASLVFITSVVFTISTLARNTALAVAVSMLLYLGALPITMVLVINLKQVWVVNSLIPYMNNSMFKFAPFVLQSIQEQFGVGLNPAMGILQLLIVSLVLLVITFVTFIKKDVKN
ncbi:MAG: ABC transporter permease subunit [Clostridium sp.]|uniref:ABC transporter permease n=1 Tax=Clostridium sp. TaxID=1506 RepID=UPI00302E8D3E